MKKNKEKEPQGHKKYNNYQAHKSRKMFEMW